MGWDPWMEGKLGRQGNSGPHVTKMLEVPDVTTLTEELSTQRHGTGSWYLPLLSKTRYVN